MIRFVLVAAAICLSLAAGALESPFIWRQSLIEFWPGADYLGRDAFECNSPHRVADDALTLTVTGSRLRVKPFSYTQQKPFPGPAEVTVRTDPVPAGASATLSVKTRERGAKPVTFTTDWKDGCARFKTALDARQEYVFVSLELVLTNAASTRKVVLRSVEGTYRTPFADAISFEMTTKSPLHVLDWKLAETAVARLGNRSDHALRVTGSLSASDFYGRSFEVPVDATIGAQGQVALPLPRGGTGASAKGVWRVAAKVKCEDGSSCEREDRFAILDEHTVTPKIPYGTFRAGIHCHSARGLDADRELIHDAAVRMGAKIVRIDDVFSQFATWDAAKKDHDFANAERFLAGLERRGLAVDAIIQECRFNHFTADYCERFARHFGERIDYYEVGNEWDLATTNWLTPAAAVEWQRLAYQAIKRGCPKARVTTNGWAVEDSAGHANVTQKGFQETFMKEARGAYDIHAMHLHFPYPDFARRLERFFALRRDCGVTVPFILNETAVGLRYRGEEEVADNVWFKIITGWAHGAHDYIWYSVRDSQFDPNGCWGVMSRTYRPRLTFAAFSGLAATLGEHDFDRTVVEREGRAVYCFHRRHGREIVLAGWDLGIMKPVRVTVKTDAARVWSADVMNNRRALKVADGQAEIEIADSPCAWVFDEATFARPSEDILNVSKKPPRVIRVAAVRPDYGWDMLLDVYRQVHEEYPADPATAHRTWKGKADCSGIVLFRLRNGKPDIHISVRDEKDMPGDAVQVWRDGRDITAALKLKRTRHGDGRTVYDGAWPNLKASRVNVRFLDDDGFGGIDGWMDYAPFEAAQPDVSSWPVVRFD